MVRTFQLAIAFIQGYDILYPLGFQPYRPTQDLSQPKESSVEKFDFLSNSVEFVLLSLNRH